MSEVRKVLISKRLPERSRQEARGAALPKDNMRLPIRTPGVRPSIFCPVG